MAGFDATLGGAAATSYVTIAEADDFLSNTQYTTTWQGNTEAEKSKYLNAATFWLETLNYGGTRCDPSTDNDTLPQSLKWPRSGVTCDGIEATCSFIPKQIKEATAIIAANLTANPDAITGPIGGGGGAAAGTYVKRQKLGELEQEFAEYSSADSSCDNCDDPPLISAFPWLKDLLGCWASIINPAGGRVLTRECCNNYPFTPNRWYVRRK